MPNKEGHIRKPKNIRNRIVDFFVGPKPPAYNSSLIPQGLHTLLPEDPQMFPEFYHALEGYTLDQQRLRAAHLLDNILNSRRSVVTASAIGLLTVACGTIPAIVEKATPRPTVTPEALTSFVDYTADVATDQSLPPTSIPPPTVIVVPANPTDVVTPQIEDADIINENVANKIWSFEFADDFPVEEKNRLSQELKEIIPTIIDIFGPPKHPGTIKILYDKNNEWYYKAGAYAPRPDMPAGGLFISWDGDETNFQREIIIAHELGHLWGFPSFSDFKFLKTEQFLSDERSSWQIAKVAMFALRGIGDDWFMGIYIYQRDNLFFKKITKKYRDAGNPVTVNKETWSAWAEEVSPGFGKWYEKMQQAYLYKSPDGSAHVVLPNNAVSKSQAE